MVIARSELRKRRQVRIRRRIFGTVERPRLSVFRSGKHLYAQAIDDFKGKVLFSFSTNSEKFRKDCPKCGTVEGARKLGEIFGPQLKAKKIERVVFDRAGYKYHGRVKALAESLREAGIKF